MGEYNSNLPPTLPHTCALCFLPLCRHICGGGVLGRAEGPEVPIVPPAGIGPPLLGGGGREDGVDGGCLFLSSGWQGASPKTLDQQW